MITELKDKVGDTSDPYVDKTDNNEAQNINTKTLKKVLIKIYYKFGWIQLTSLKHTIFNLLVLQINMTVQT